MCVHKVTATNGENGRNGEGKAHLQGLGSWERISKALRDGRSLETSKISFSYSLGASEPERAKG